MTYQFRLSNIFSVSISTISFGFILHSIRFIWLVQTPEAFGDFWTWVNQFIAWKSGHLTFTEFVAPLNEHRIVTSRLFFLADSVFDQMNGVIPTVVSLCTLALSGLLLWRLAELDGTLQNKFKLPPLFWVAWMMSTCQVIRWSSR